MDICFQGTHDHNLWGIDINGGGITNIGGQRTKSTPVVFGNFIYFQGDDDYNALWRIGVDGTGIVNLGQHRCASPPTVTAGFIYFQGTDDILWKVTLDGNASIPLANNGVVWRTASTPVVSKNYIWFQGTDKALWRINLDGSDPHNFNNFTTASPPCVIETDQHQYVFFQGTDSDGTLWRMNFDGSDPRNPGALTSAQPVFGGGFLWIRGTDGALWRLDTDFGGQQMGSQRTGSAPSVGNGYVVYQGDDDHSALWRLDIHDTSGESAVNLGGYTTATTPFVIGPGNQPKTGTLTPHYQILTLFYAPPGTAKEHDSDKDPPVSSVTYGSNSTTGTANSTSKSFTIGTEVSVSTPGGLSADYNMSRTVTDTSTVEITKSQSNEIGASGSAKDGIDHDQDTFFLWLNAQLTLTVDPQGNVNWEPGLAYGDSMLVQYVTVGELKNPSLIAPNVKEQFDQAGMTPADYAAILKVNPFAYGDPPIVGDLANRYLPIPESVAYRHGPPIWQGRTVANAIGSSTSHTTEQDYEVTFSASADFVVAKMESKTSMKWTSISTRSATTASSQEAKVTIWGPSSAYSGTATIQLYWDVIYKTFLFKYFDH